MGWLGGGAEVMRETLGLMGLLEVLVAIAHNKSDAPLHRQAAAALWECARSGVLCVCVLVLVW